MHPLLALVPKKPPGWTDSLLSLESLDKTRWVEKINSVIAESSQQSGEVVLHADFLVTSKNNKRPNWS